MKNGRRWWWLLVIIQFTRLQFHATFQLTPNQHPVADGLLWKRHPPPCSSSSDASHLSEYLCLLDVYHSFIRCALLAKKSLNHLRRISKMFAQKRVQRAPHDWKSQNARREWGGEEARGQEETCRSRPIFCCGRTANLNSVCVTQRLDCENTRERNIHSLSRPLS